MLDEGVCGTIDELAKCEWVNGSYMSRVLRLTLLAQAILDGRQPEGMRLDGFVTSTLFGQKCTHFETSCSDDLCHTAFASALK